MESVQIREAVVSDIAEIQRVRHSVKENILSDPALVTDQDVEHYLTKRGKGWVAEISQKVVGFAIVDLQDHNVWALFLHPEVEGKGIGRLLHDQMLDWYFEQTDVPLWLGTDPGTRAERFYRKAGWDETGKHGQTEVKFEMTRAQWQQTVGESIN